MTDIPVVARAAAVRPMAPSPDQPLRYTALGGLIFRMTLRGAVLTILTLGLHRFWLTTRQRKAYWAGIEIDGEPLEYDGKPTELLLGFFVAVVILAVILGGMNLALVFGGVLAGVDLQIAFNASLPLLIPLGYYARYRARRYLASRTRWRGLRFGMSPGAGRYMLVATGHLLLTILTLGLLYPRMHQRLARYEQERTFYGDLKFAQTARWQAMMGPWLLAWTVVAVLVVPSIWQGAGAYWTMINLDPEAPQLGEGVDPQAFLDRIGMLGGGLAAAFFLSWPLRRRYAAAAERVLMGGVRLGGARLTSTLRTDTLLGLDVKGWAVLAVGLIFGGILVGFLAVGALVLGGVGAALTLDDPQKALEAAASLPSLFAIAGAILFYLIFFGLISALGQVAFVHWPLRARIEALSVTDAGSLSAARQRDRDDATDAGGFADALDVGAGF